jgi:hypothetical protein
MREKGIERERRKNLQRVGAGGTRATLALGAGVVSTTTTAAIRVDMIAGVGMGTGASASFVRMLRGCLVLAAGLPIERLQRQVRDQDREQESQYCDPMLPHDGHLHVRCVHDSSMQINKRPFGDHPVVGAPCSRGNGDG